MANYIVTGGCGFIGSHLIDKLLSSGNKVFIVDNFFTGRIENLREHISDFKEINKESPDGKYILSENLVLFKGDINDESVLREVFSEDIDFIFNLAAIVSVPYSMSHEEETMKVNHYSIKKIVELAKEFKVKGIVQAGSSAEYGDDVELPIKEESANDDTVHISPYGRSKYLSTRFLLENSSEDFKTVILRFFNVYGSRQDPSSPYSGVISKFFDFANNGEDITIFGDGSQTRDFVHVSDIVNALVSALEGKSGVYNVGNGNFITVDELAKLVVDLSGTSSEVKHLSAREGDILHSYANIDGITRNLNWKPLMPLDKGLKLTYDWYSKS